MSNREPETLSLPTPPAGAWWEVRGKPTAPWVWSTEDIWRHDDWGRILDHAWIVSASAGEAYAALRWEKQ